MMLQALKHLLRPQNTSRIIPTYNATTCSFHKNYNSKYEEQTFQLADSRQIGFAEYGDLQGIPMFYIHGSPASRYDGVWFAETAQKLNIRLICPDRPGQGLSSFRHGRKLIDYPRDIAELAEHLNIAKYHVIGHSGGGPYAIACAYGSPNDELLSASVLAGLGHPACLTIREDGWQTPSVMFLAKWTPGLLRYLMNQAIGDDAKLEKANKYIQKNYMTKEEAAAETPENEAIGLASIKQAYAQGANGPVQDIQVCGGPWGFELKDVKRQVNLFWGLKDKNAWPSHGRYFKEHLPKAELFEFEEMTHFNVERYEEEIFRRILGTWQPQSE